ncbi:MAG TPA: hypothetical protein PKD85_16060 [Saprospiraceae bacterium]|nr:hypothetical protein [Saprospiraceae bacterium]
MQEYNNVPVVKSISPFYQAGFALILILVFDMVTISSAKGEISKLATQIWTNCIAMVLFYIVANCLLSLRSSTNSKYVRDSIFAFLILSFIGIFISQILSNKTMDESGSFRWLFIVLGVGYMIFLGIINTMKFVVDWAKKQDSSLRGENKS